MADIKARTRPRTTTKPIATRLVFRDDRPALTNALRLLVSEEDVLNAVQPSPSNSRPPVRKGRRGPGRGKPQLSTRRS
jgi:hypothetical protein